MYTTPCVYVVKLFEDWGSAGARLCPQISCFRGGLGLNNMFLNVLLPGRCLIPPAAGICVQIMDDNSKAKTEQTGSYPATPDSHGRAVRAGTWELFPPLRTHMAEPSELAHWVNLRPTIIPHNKKTAKTNNNNNNKVRGRREAHVILYSLLKAECTRATNSGVYRSVRRVLWPWTVACS